MGRGVPGRMTGCQTPTTLELNRHHDIPQRPDRIEGRARSPDPGSTILATAKAEAIAKVRELKSSLGLTAAALASPAWTKEGIKLGSKIESKYRDEVDASTWSSRGLKPNWLSTSSAARSLNASDYVFWRCDMPDQ